MKNSERFQYLSTADPDAFFSGGVFDALGIRDVAVIDLKTGIVYVMDVEYGTAWAPNDVCEYVTGKSLKYE